MAETGRDVSIGNAGPSTGPAPDGSSPPSPAKQTAAQLMLHAIDKSLRMKSLYEGKGQNYTQSRNHAFSLMEKLLQQFGTIKLHIEPRQFVLDGEPVWINESEKQGPAYRMFKDGLRIITFKPGMELVEFLLLLQAMEDQQLGEQEHNAVTLLWEGAPKHIKHRAIRMFHEGMEDSDLGGGNEDIRNIVGMLNQPLHRTRIPYPQSAAPPEAVSQAKELREKLGAMLKDQGTHEQFLQGLRKEVANAQEEVWPRAIHIASRMIQLGLDAAQVSSILSHVLEEMLAEGEWADLGQTCKVMSATMTLDNEDGAENTHLKSILERLTKEGRLLAMEARLIIATPEEFDMLIDFLKVLPEGANDTLRDLLLKMPRGEAQTKFRQLLEDREVDLTDHYARSLNSNNQEQVMAAISVLTDMGTPEALAKIPRVFSHPSARVRLEAIKSMKGKVKPGDLADEVVGQLVGTLAASYPSLHEAAYDLIKDVPRSSRGEDLIALLEKPETASKLDSVRKFRISILLIRWGGTAVDDFIIDTICASGLFVRRKQAQLKGEMLDALERVGGDRARNLIAACRARQPAKTVRAQLDEAAKKLR